MRPATDLASFVGGFTCAEGHFSHSGTRFAFAVALGAPDSATCGLLRAFFGVGVVGAHPRRKEHYDDEVVFRVQRLRDLVEVIVPFMDEHLAPSYKRTQYDAWRSSLLTYWEHGAKRQRSCAVDGCDQPHRSRGLCRRHYFQTYGA